MTDELIEIGQYTKLDESPFYIWASRRCFFILRLYLLIFLVVLDPRIFYSGLLADCGDDLSIKSHLELVKGQLVQRYREQYLRDAPPPTQQQPVVLPSTSSTSPQKVNFTARYKQ
jgi:hypothetical protein